MMNLISARTISQKYGLQCSVFDFDHTLHVHFLDGASFVLATKRAKRWKTNTSVRLLKEVSEREFRAMCRKVQHHPKTEAERDALQIVIDFQKYIGSKTVSIKSARYYPEFRLVTFMGDGFPCARFVFSEDFKKVFFTFSSDATLQYAANPKAIPHIFPIEEFKKWLSHVSI